MKKWIASILLAFFGLGVVAYWSSRAKVDEGADHGSRGFAAEPSAASGNEGRGSRRMSPGVRVVRVGSHEIFRDDPRLFALSREELDWMRRHQFPGRKELEALATLDVDALDGTDDARLATLQGLALLQRGDDSGMAVLFKAGALGSIYGYEEAAIAQWRMLQERLGKGPDLDDMLMGHLEVARALGDYKVDYLVEKYLPGYPIAERASTVQRHTTEFLRQLGANANLRGVRTPGIDPRPGLEQWRDLQVIEREEKSIQVDTYVED